MEFFRKMAKAMKKFLGKSKSFFKPKVLKTLLLRRRKCACIIHGVSEKGEGICCRRAVECWLFKNFGIAFTFIKWHSCEKFFPLRGNQNIFPLNEFVFQSLRRILTQPKIFPTKLLQTLSSRDVKNWFYQISLSFLRFTSFLKSWYLEHELLGSGRVEEPVAILVEIRRRSVESLRRRHCQRRLQAS